MEINSSFADINEEKRKIRKDILQKRTSIPMELRKMADLAIADRIIGHQWFYRAEVLLGFVNYDSEISTIEILSEALSKGKKLFLPKIEGEDMFFYHISSLDELIEGYKGILEPKGDTERFSYSLYKDSRILILMPGVAFDIYGYRMGYGKGFYDRFLADKEILRTYSIGIGYKCQQVEKLPVDEYDIKPYQVILV
jgi:5-formyltetrahydrofolate cyclo-ligase